MPRSHQRHTLRKLLVLAVIVGIVVAYRNATADRGGSYDPADADPR
jgi:hypothetical protein